MKEIKIKEIYVLKKLVGSCFGFIVIMAIIFGTYQAGADVFGSVIIYLGIFALVMPVSFVILLLKLLTFSYDLGEDFINIKQGIINRQERHLPYSVIQDVIIRQDLLDRLFGLSTIVIENASMGGAIMPQYGRGNSYGGVAANSRYQVYDFPGMTMNMLIIPGLARTDALKLRDIVLEKTEKAVSKGGVNQL